MLMKWTDLEVGDTLRYTPEFKSAITNSPLFREEFYKYETLTVIYFQSYPDYMYLRIEAHDGRRFDFYLLENGKMWRQDGIDFPVVFEIVELRE